MNAETILSAATALVNMLNQLAPALSTQDQAKLAEILAQANASADQVHKDAQGI